MMGGLVIVQTGLGGHPEEQIEAGIEGDKELCFLGEQLGNLVEYGVGQWTA